MGVRITADENVVALFDSVSGFAFGPTFNTAEDASDFLEWCEKAGEPDLRTLNGAQLEQLHSDFYASRESL